MAMFDLNETQKQLFEMAKDFSNKEVWPKARELDETAKFPMELLKKTHELGMLNAFVPEEVGGLGLGTFDHCLISEALAMGSAGFCTAALANDLAAVPVILSENKHAWKDFLAPMVEECQMASYCVTEPGAGSDVAGIKTTAKKSGDKYILNGAKMWITNANYASWFFVLAKTDPSKGHKGMSGFIVSAKSPGITIGRKEDNMGQRCSDTRGVTFDNVEVPAKYLLGKEGDGFKLAMGAFDRTRPAVAAEALGLSQRAMMCSIDYAKQRQAFGKTISENQGVSFIIAEMARDIEAARLLVWKAADEVDAGRKNTYYASIAKMFAADACMRITTDAVQIFGGYGYNREYPVEMLMRDAKIFQIYEGTSQIQRMIVGRMLLDV
ncbi:acyl-CoA dehydrogenase family protein [Fluviispira multicolorata]|uniref:Acyl-CoA dehydrogenase n=1 Tax=Fluviispira multicolorata TaxID=2654512 RepID=A0A833JF31_9BACT|nr:acyl-CoA dehydrogenase family protein [Fluviispira multicolorata]KAB8030820.1 acyl-CoA dehydrogenase [Fluviispira multicolorata]